MPDVRCCLLKAAGGAARLNEAQPENLQVDAAAAAAQVPDSASDFQLGDESDHGLQTLTLQSMLRHMEEIQVSASLPEGRRQIEKGTMDRLLFLAGRSPAVFTDAVSVFFFPLSVFLTFKLFF